MVHRPNPPVFVNNILLESSLAILSYIVSGSICAVVLEVNNCDYMALKSLKYLLFLFIAKNCQYYFSLCATFFNLSFKEPHPGSLTLHSVFFNP